MHASGFRPRLQLLDRLLLEKVNERDPGVANLASVTGGRPVLFAEWSSPGFPDT